MGFTDWVKRSELAATALSRYGSLRDVLQAAYKAGEREGRKQVEEIAANAVELAVLVELEECAKVCETRMIEYTNTFPPGGNYQRTPYAHECAAAIREPLQLELYDLSHNYTEKNDVK